VNAHAQMDLSRRDDLISWFYVLLDLLHGSLPWKAESNSAEVATMKSKFDVVEAVEDFSPRLVDIWRHIASLKFEEEPNYAMIHEILRGICLENHINEEDPYDWASFLDIYRKTLAGEFGTSLRIDGSTDTLPYYTELGIPPVIMQQIEGQKGGLKSPLVRQMRRNYAMMQASEINEPDQKGCCC
jgi:hypothetical protein